MYHLYQWICPSGHRNETAVVCGMHNCERVHAGWKVPSGRNTQSLGDSTAQLVELKAQIRALQNMDCEFPTLIVCDLFYCVQSYNEYLHYGARMSRDSSVHSEAQAALGTIGKAERKPATGACYSCIESSTCWRSRCREFNGG